MIIDVNRRTLHISVQDQEVPAILIQFARIHCLRDPPLESPKSFIFSEFLKVLHISTF